MGTNMEERNTSHVQSAARALMLLDLLARENREMSLTEIANAMNWPKSTVHGLIATMRDHSYVDQSLVSGCYRLGVRLFELGNIVARSWDIRTLALPAMQNLNNKLGEMVQLATEDKGEDGKVSVGQMILPKIEAELAFVLAADLIGGKVTARDVISATEYVMGAFEIVDSRVRTGKSSWWTLWPTMPPQGGISWEKSGLGPLRST